ncbi:unnamed protein product [Cylicocyclus nassatus]|uniref:Uncharacterized protein n=1 Tax=Cylicocyclus nassatus TaxID=53992 RepID=A0AA36GFQ5_CYLNA|nr:unnamed protein product [Cylicocyclus nassatus]
MSRKLFFVLVMLVCAAPEDFFYKYEWAISKRCLFACDKVCPFRAIRRINGYLYFRDRKCMDCFYKCAREKEQKGSTPKSVQEMSQ